jgi:hypothetical protein
MRKLLIVALLFTGCVASSDEDAAPRASGESGYVRLYENPTNGDRCYYIPSDAIDCYFEEDE